MIGILCFPWLVPLLSCHHILPCQSIFENLSYYLNNDGDLGSYFDVMIHIILWIRNPFYLMQQIRDDRCFWDTIHLIHFRQYGFRCFPLLLLIDVSLVQLIILKLFFIIEVSYDGFLSTIFCLIWSLLYNKFTLSMKPKLVYWIDP